MIPKSVNRHVLQYSLPLPFCLSHGAYFLQPSLDIPAGRLQQPSLLALFHSKLHAAKEIAADQGVDGAMLAVGTSAQEARKLLQGSKGYAVVAAVNSPNSVSHYPLNGTQTARAPWNAAFRTRCEMWLKRRRRLSRCVQQW